MDSEDDVYSDALEAIELELAKHPNDISLQLARDSVEGIRRHLRGESGHEASVMNPLGLLIAREIEPLSQDLAEKLYRIEEIRVNCPKPRM